MPSKASRRAISIRGDTYDRLQKYCKENGFTISGLVEGLVAHFFENLPQDEDAPRDRPAPSAPPFQLKSLKKEELPPAKPEPIRGGGIHSL